MNTSKITGKEKLKKLRRRLFPEGSQRFRIYALFSKAVHKALDDGLPSTLGASMRFLRRRLFGKHSSPKNYHREEAIKYYSSPTLLDVKSDVEYRERLLQNPWVYPDNSQEDFTFSMLILNKDKPEYIIPLLESLRKEGLGRYYEVIVGDTGTTDGQVLQYYQKVGLEVRIVENLQYHFSKNYNYLITTYARGQIVCIMNNDLILPDTPFLTTIESIFTDESIGIVGAKLLYPDGKLQHGGVFFFDNGDIGGLPYHRLHGRGPGKLPTMATELVPAVTGAFLFCRKADFISLHGFDETYQQEAQDIDLCLKYRRSGKEVVFANIDDIIHIENGTRQKGDENWHDRHYFLWKWKSFLEAAILTTRLNKEFKAELEEVKA